MFSYEHTSDTRERQPIHLNNMIPSSNGPRKHSSRWPMVPRFLSTDTIDISSKKGRFAWEKPPHSDIYVPVIFRGNEKFTSVNMVQKLLSDYPQDVMKHTSDYNYWKTITFYEPTVNEIVLLNTINAKHCNYAYGRNQSSVLMRLVALSEFLPFFEHLRLYKRSNTSQINVDVTKTINISGAPTHNVVASILNMGKNRQGIDVLKNSNVGEIHHTTGQSESNKLPVWVRVQSRSVAPVIVGVNKTKRSFQFDDVSAYDKPPNKISKVNESKVLAIRTPNISPARVNEASRINQPEHINKHPLQNSNYLFKPASDTDNTGIIRSRPNSDDCSTFAMFHGASLARNESHMNSVTNATAPSTSAYQDSQFRYGWLQINKLYTPFVSDNNNDRQSYKIPLCLLAVYKLLNFSSADLASNSTQGRPNLPSVSQASPQEILIINELCSKQSIQQFSSNVKLISLETFYRYSSADMLFIKELPSNDPKSGICKEWQTVVRLFGGICRLQNVSTLEVLMVPFVGNKLLKDLLPPIQSEMPSKSMQPTTIEIEFLRLVCFFANIDVNLTQLTLINMDEIKPYYKKDLTVCFNDKFPLGVLSYPKQVISCISSEASVALLPSTNTNDQLIEPGPSTSLDNPGENERNTPALNAKSPSACSSKSQSRYQRTIDFHGHCMNAYACSSPGGNNHRECVSVRDLCALLHPNTTINEKIEKKMLSLLKAKKISRFRPQHLDGAGITRLADVKDVLRHWQYIEHEMLGTTTTIAMHRTDDITSLHTQTEEMAFPSLHCAPADDILKSTEVKSDSCVKAVSAMVIKTVQHKNTCTELHGLDNTFAPHIDGEENMPRVAEVLESTVMPFEELNTEQGTMASNEYEQDVKIHRETDSDQENRVRTTKESRKVFTANKFYGIGSSRKTRPTCIPYSKNTEKVTMKTKKRIYLKRRRKPCSRNNRTDTAAWVKRYNIERCWVQLEPYEPRLERNE